MGENNKRKEYDPLVFFNLNNSSRNNILGYRNKGNSQTLVEAGRGVKYYNRDLVNRIINFGTIKEKVDLSRSYFNANGIYSRLIMHYGTFLKNTGVLIPEAPNPAIPIDNKKNIKRYNDALTFLEKMNLENFLREISIRVIRDGSYYGLIKAKGKQDATLITLPFDYCRSIYTNDRNIDIVEFNVSYFDSIFSISERAAILSTFPERVQIYYNNFKKVKGMERWMLLTVEEAVCFRLVNNVPYFLSIIPTLLDYETAVDLGNKREAEEIKKVIINHIPSTKEGDFLLEPEEAENLHKGVVNTFSENKNISVITTYAETEIANSKTTTDSTSSSNIERMKNNVYNTAGVSSQIFSATGNIAMENSLNNDLAFMMTLADKYSTFFTELVNNLFGNSNMILKYKILPISWYNYKDYATEALKQANTGYSFLLPALAMGINQVDIINLKILENTIMKLDELLIPLKTSYTQSGDDDGGDGRPEKDDKNKTEKTITNIEGGKGNDTEEE